MLFLRSSWFSKYLCVSKCFPSISSWKSPSAAAGTSDTIKTLLGNGIGSLRSTHSPVHQQEPGATSGPAQIPWQKGLPQRGQEMSFPAPWHGTAVLPSPRPSHVLAPWVAILFLSHRRNLRVAGRGTYIGGDVTPSERRCCCCKGASRRPGPS